MSDRQSETKTNSSPKSLHASRFTSHQAALVIFAKAPIPVSQPSVPPIAAPTTPIACGLRPLSTVASAWQLLAVDFVVPADLPAVTVAIRQIPRYRYTEPTQGAIWFDDFSLKAQ